MRNNTTTESHREVAARWVAASEPDVPTLAQLMAELDAVKATLNKFDPRRVDLEVARVNIRAAFR
jgi:hypothetical protein